MRIRSLIAAGIVAAALAPAVGHAGNPEDCSSQIEMRSGSAILSPSATLNCETLNDPSLTYSPIYPGGSADILFTGEEPIAGNRFTGFGSYLTYTQTNASGGTTETKLWLTWTPAEAIGGPLEGRWNSQDFTIGARGSIDGGDIYVHVLEPTQVIEFADACTEDEPSVCYIIHERTFKTLTNWADGV